MGKRLRTSVEIASGYTVNDRRGQTQSALYNNPSIRSNEWTPLFYSLGDEPEKVITPYERRQQIAIAREQFATNPLVSATVIDKNQASVGNAWLPKFMGIRVDKDGKHNTKDVEWGDKAYDWLVNYFYPRCNWDGPNFNFQETLYLTGKEIDIDGGSLMLPKVTKDGLPAVQLVTVDRIGSRGLETEITSGTYKGDFIYDGVVYSGKSGMVVGYKVLGSDKDEDAIVSAFDSQYLFEPQWSRYGHGISRVAHAVKSLRDIRDINENNLIAIKNYSAKGVILKNARGSATGGNGNQIFSTEITPPSGAQGTNTKKIFYENVTRGGTHCLYGDAEMTPFNFDRPSPNTEAFLTRLGTEAVATMGWCYELVIPQGLNGNSTRFVQGKARRSVADRQATLNHRAKRMVTFGLAKAMELGLVPKTDNPNWMLWGFEMPAQLSIDDGRDMTNNIEALRLGIITRSAVVASSGQGDWYDVDKQTVQELRSKLEDARALAKEFGMTETEARQLVFNKGVAPLAQALPADSKPTTEN